MGRGEARDLLLGRRAFTLDALTKARRELETSLLKGEADEEVVREVISLDGFLSEEEATTWCFNRLQKLHGKKNKAENTRLAQLASHEWIHNAAHSHPFSYKPEWIQALLEDDLEEGKVVELEMNQAVEECARAWNTAGGNHPGERALTDAQEAYQRLQMWWPSLGKDSPLKRSVAVSVAGVLLNTWRDDYHMWSAPHGYYSVYDYIDRFVDDVFKVADVEANSILWCEEVVSEAADTVVEDLAEDEHASLANRLQMNAVLRLGSLLHESSGVEIKRSLNAIYDHIRAHTDGEDARFALHKALFENESL